MTQNWPDYIVEIGFTDGGGWQLGLSQFGVDTLLAGPYGGAFAIFQTVDGFQSASTRRGRNDQLGFIQAGTAHIIMDNSNGYLSPENAGSPYYPNILPQRLIRLSAVWQGVTYYLFSGYIDTYTPVDEGPDSGSMALDCVDWFGWANDKHALDIVRPAEDEGARIAAVLAAVGTQGYPTAIDVGEENLLAASILAANPLTHIQDVCTAERGIFFHAANGQITFHNRHHRLSAPLSTTVQASFGQPDATTGRYAPGVLGYVNMPYILDKTYIYNDIQVTASNTTEAMQENEDAQSEATFGTRTMQIDSPVMNVGNAAYLGQWILRGYKDSKPRVTGMTLDGDSDPAIWPQLLGRDIGDRIYARKDRPQHLSFAREMWIEGVEHTIAPDKGGHQVHWDLSDTSYYGPVPWQLGISQFGVNTTLSY